MFSPPPKSSVSKTEETTPTKTEENSSESRPERFVFFDEIIESFTDFRRTDLQL